MRMKGRAGVHQPLPRRRRLRNKAGVNHTHTHLYTAPALLVHVQLLYTMTQAEDIGLFFIPIGIIVGLSITSQTTTALQE